MMKPEKVEFFIYAENSDEVLKLQKSLNAFVREHYNSGVIVTASKLTEAIKRFGCNMIVSSYLKKK